MCNWGRLQRKLVGRGGPASYFPFAHSSRFFREILGQFDLLDFFGNYWEKTPLHISRKCPHYYFSDKVQDALLIVCKHFQENINNLASNNICSFSSQELLNILKAHDIQVALSHSRLTRTYICLMHIIKSTFIYILVRRWRPFALSWLLLLSEGLTVVVYQEFGCDTLRRW